MRLSAVTRVLSRHRLPALVIVLVAALTGLGLGVLLGDRGSTALAPSDEPLPSATADASQTADPTPEPSSPMPAASPSASVEAASTPAPTPSPSPVAASNLPVEGFAEVVADRLVMRVAPGLSSDVLQYGQGGDHPPGYVFPTATIGRDTEWTLVYLLDGPVAADGYDWYLAAATRLENSWPEYLGWIAAGDAQDAWLVQTDVPCPEAPVQLADVTYTALPRLTVIYCLGGQELTLRGYYTAPPPGEPLEGECVSEPAWLVCSFGWHTLRVLEAPWAGDGNHLGLQLHPDMGLMPPRPGWIEVTGQFDHPAAAECGNDQPGTGFGTSLQCRSSFVVTSARSSN
jgi:hypothetical protein